MTTEEKHKIAHFLVLAGDFLGSGYRSEQKEYNFIDSDEGSNIINESKQIEGIHKVEGDSIDTITEEIRLCKACPLHTNRKNTVPGEGVKSPLVMVIGEGPGEKEDLQGRPFVGNAGQLLDKMLASIGLSRETNAFIANTVKCRPPFNRDPAAEETSACRSFLERQILLLKPSFILIAGKVAAQSLLNTTEPIGKLRGKIGELKVSDKSFPVLCTYHPSALLHNEELKRPVWEDLKLLKSKI
ncbi:MAG: uracil-DNA glycosylase [Treponema sp.]|nr:uracil-DNA glycosylase [Treponema sp.]